jgi:hypothetical protein
MKRKSSAPLVPPLPQTKICTYKKINWDATLDPGRKKIGIWVVIRDETGGFYVAHAMFVPYLLAPTMVEALGAWVAVSLGCE